MCFHNKDVGMHIAQSLLDAGANEPHALVIHRTKDGSYRTAWYVKVTDRMNIANVMKDIANWHADKTAKWDFTNLNAKREQLDLPPLDPDEMIEPDRPMQRHWDDKEINLILEGEMPIPGEDEAQLRIT